MGRVSETREIYKTLDLALRVGEVLLSSGAGAADVAATMLSVARATGLRGVDVDVTFTALSMSHQPSYDEPAMIQTRNVKQRDIDYEDLTEVDILVQEILLGEATLDEARTRLNRIVSSGHKLPKWAVSLGWGFMGLGVAFIVGGDLVVAAIAFVAAAGIDVLKRPMQRRRIPFFYQ
ncbi:MAG TPA: threonine/serine exporter family protein, partial [Nocardioidaceae bacterium]|nr:threonine/serine exporter family protein [Nocardioidaceae bacterium]